MSEYEKPGKGNPNRLVIRQHVFPAESIRRFANKDGFVELGDGKRQNVRLAKYDDSIFCGQRAWDQRAECGYMRRIEDEFQAIADKVIENGGPLSVSENQSVSRFYALWYMRARYRKLESQEIEAKGVTGSALTKEQEENLEKNGYSFARLGGRIPARQINGIVLQRRIDQYEEQLAATCWSRVQALAGEFLVPDVPAHTLILLTPSICLVAPSEEGNITRENLAEINFAAMSNSHEYIFAKSFRDCPVKLQ